MLEQAGGLPGAVCAGHRRDELLSEADNTRGGPRRMDYLDWRDQQADSYTPWPGRTADLRRGCGAHRESVRHLYEDAEYRRCPIACQTIRQGRVQAKRLDRIWFHLFLALPGRSCRMESQAQPAGLRQRTLTILSESHLTRPKRKH